MRNDHRTGVDIPAGDDRGSLSGAVDMVRALGAGTGTLATTRATASAVPAKVSLVRGVVESVHDADAARAAALLGDGPLRPTGAVADALAAGRLLRTTPDDVLDAREALLRTGHELPGTSEVVGAGINGQRSKATYADPDDAARTITAVFKPASAQAAQEELGWRAARQLGADHLVPTVGRDATGGARIEFRPGESLVRAQVNGTDTLEGALFRSYADDAGLGLSELEAAQAARIDRQVLQLLDYVMANNDRHRNNGLFDAAKGVLSFIDFGHSGRGVRTAAGSELAPSLRLFQGSKPEFHVDLDDAVVDYVRRRTSGDALRAEYSRVVSAPSSASPGGSSIVGELREGMATRLEHALERRGYDHAEYDDIPELQIGMRGGLAQARFGFEFDGAGFGGGMPF
jgi:hypothetical protein